MLPLRKALALSLLAGAGLNFAADSLRAVDAVQDQSDATTPRLIITASPPDTSLTSPSVDTARANLQTFPGATAVQDDTELKRGRGSYLEDALPFQPGLIIQSSQGSEDDKVSSRGSGVQSDDVIGLSLLIDGIPLNQADGEAYLRDVDLQSVKYAEIYRGADALRYGGVTLGGAINLVTVTGRDASPFTIRGTFGSFGFYEQQVTSGFARGNWDFYGSVVNNLNDGYRDHAQENSQKVFLSLGTQLNQAAENRLYFFFGHLNQNNPSGLAKDDMYADPRQADPEAIQERWNTQWDYYRVMDRFVVKGDEWQAVAAFSWNHRQVLNRDEYEDDFRLGTTRYYSDDYGADLMYDNTSNLFGGKNRFSVGLVPTFEPESDAFYANPDGHLGELLFNDRTYYLNVPVYAENQHYFFKGFSLLTGAQFDYVRRIFRGRNQSLLGEQLHDDYFLAFNPKVGLAYEWAKKNIVYFNASRSFQPPSFDESLTVVEGEDGGQRFNVLNSQKAITIELGTRGEFGPLEWDIALYRSWVRDELLDQNNNLGVSIGTINAPDTIHQGIEAGLEAEIYRGIFAKGSSGTPRRVTQDSKDGKQGQPAVAASPSDRVVLEGAYTLSDFRFDGNPVYGDNRIAGTPVNFLKAELRYEHPSGFYLGVNTETNITRYPVDETNSLYADHYALLGVRAGYRTKHGLQVYFEAKNLTNEIYAASVEPLGDARTSDDVQAFNPGNGRAFYGGLQWIW